MTLIAALRNMWYSSSGKVCEGATTMESPVWVPRGSKFSMLQQMMVFLEDTSNEQIMIWREMNTYIRSIPNHFVFQLLPPFHATLYKDLRAQTEAFCSQIAKLICILGET
jgi:hypothetical protein